VLVVDGSSLFKKGRAQNYLEPEHAGQILELTQKFEDVQDRARVVTLKEIEDEEWTLNISRYVLPPIGEDIPPLDVAIADFKAAWEKAQEAEDKLRKLLQDNGYLEREEE
jgi:type I restriction enzyme M protein